MALDQPDDVNNAADAKEMSFLDHVDELRGHLFRSVAAIFIATTVAFTQKVFIFDTLIFGPKQKDFWTYEQFCKLGKLLNRPDLCMNEIGFVVSNITMSGQFTQHVYVAFITGLIISFPFILWEAWKFIKPALKSKERNKVRGVVFFSSILFFIGVLFGYFFLTPISLLFLGTYRVSEQVTNEINLDSYIDFVATMTMVTGAVFELPVLVFFLAKLGLVTAAFMKKYRRYAFIIILIVASVITPPDITSMVLMTIPLYALYELSILIAWRVDRQKKQAA